MAAAGYGIDSGPGLSDWTGMTSGTKPPAACLIGWPAAHSRSPLIHHYWLRTLGIAGGYVIEAVPPDEFKDFIFRLSLRGFVGANVTMPHKERALALSKPDERARAVGAANTLWFENGELCSTNTDVEGFINNLDASAPGWDGCEDALVLGAGGAAHAVVFGLLDRGIKRVHLANRTIARARVMADQFGANVLPVAWDAQGDILPRAGLLVNTTSLGMKGQPPLELDVGRLPSHAVVADLVYVPLDTPLLAAARVHGLKTADGLGMLLHQAVRGFELWFGRRPVVTAELRALVEADLTNT
jgi:shikimate dehydrogenase